MRRIKDLPIQEYKVILNINSKVFFCENKNCDTKIFPEQFDFIESHERDIDAVKNGIKYEYNNGLAEGYVNKSNKKNNVWQKQFRITKAKVSSTILIKLITEEPILFYHLQFK